MSLSELRKSSGGLNLKISSACDETLTVLGLAMLSIETSKDDDLTFNFGGGCVEDFGKLNFLAPVKVFRFSSFCDCCGTVANDLGTLGGSVVRKSFFSVERETQTI